MINIVEHSTLLNTQKKDLDDSKKRLFLLKMDYLYELLDVYQDNIQPMAIAGSTKKFETGGFIYIGNLENPPFVVATTRGSDVYIESMHVYHPLIDGKVSYHIHPNILADQYDKLYSLELRQAILTFPSNLDLDTLTRATLFYKEIVPDVILTEWGITISQMSQELLDILMSHDEDEREDIIEVLAHNIASGFHLFITGQVTRTELSNALANVFEYTDENNIDKSCGFSIFFIPFSTPSEDIILKSDVVADTLDELEIS